MSQAHDSSHPQDASGNMWSGRFQEATDSFVQEFTASIGFDQRFAMQDIQGSHAHANMLAKQGILTEDEVSQIHQGLQEIAKDIQAGEFQYSVALEDIHMNIEAALTDKIGRVGKKLHTGRSRNDQVATDIKLYVREAIDRILKLIQDCQNALLEKAEQEADTIFPGFTHLQCAQPITFGHHMMAYFEMLERDYSRFADCQKRLNLCPLGAGALAGTTFDIDRQHTASALGFNAPTRNSLDSVSDRDFAIEFTQNASVLMMHLSRLSEELIIWASAQFALVDLPDRFCTGSSIMPQKKNPDVPELVRGKVSRVTGHSLSLLMLMKSQPLAYNKDNQEDKEPLFDTIDTVMDCLTAYIGMIPHLQVDKARAKEAANAGYATATDLADYLVRAGLPFRDAHEVVGQAVAYAIDNKLMLDEIPLAMLQSLSNLIKDDVFDVLTVEGSVAARNHLGGTAPEQVRHAVTVGRQLLADRG